eukprot:CAMPEP_0179483502 /NCGR_PEP_ID=MMETSP0799-20121207/60677_1 /TAXON_ID=46947 /ORGANISM="Geminigera cryophila, Strain CCMP2564" /LENGTH=158 /DNA_ID=CAMNT_0021297067 /DNA_START=390 /DNA_END=867 /DNA_ORIENTATION=+
MPEAHRSLLVLFHTGSFTPRVEAAMLSHCGRMSCSTGSGDDLGVAKVLRLDLRRHQPVNFVVLAEHAITSQTKRKESPLHRHDQRVSIAEAAISTRDSPNASSVPTRTGASLLVQSPSPSWPQYPKPQDHSSAPPTVTATVCASPADTRTTAAPPNAL